MPRDTKQRMVEAAAGLLRSRGLAAMSFTDVLAVSGAARGVIYHHFPGGKAELAREAAAWTGRSVRVRLAALDADDPETVVTSFLAAVRPVVAESAAGSGCAVAAVTGECAQLDAELTAVSHGALRSWVDELDRHLRRTGASADAAAVLSTLMITFLEGTHVLCRAEGNLEPFDSGAAGVTAAARALLRPPL
jgi:AcrR family transcriptional regulator